jgi:hypothetical protein
MCPSLIRGFGHSEFHGCFPSHRVFPSIHRHPCTLRAQMLLHTCLSPKVKKRFCFFFSTYCFFFFLTHFTVFFGFQLRANSKLFFPTSSLLNVPILKYIFFLLALTQVRASPLTRTKVIYFLEKIFSELNYW